MSDLAPARAVHPGRIIKRELEARDWTPATLAKLSRLPIEEIEKIIAGDRAITTKIAEALETAFDVPSDFWNNLQTLYESDKAAIASARRGHRKEAHVKARRRLAGGASASANTKRRPERSTVAVPRTVARRGTRKPKA